MQVILDETTAGWKLCDIRALLGAIFEDYLKVRGERVDEFSGRFGPIVPIRFVSTHSVASYAGRLTPPRSLIAGGHRCTSSPHAPEAKFNLRFQRGPLRVLLSLSPLAGGVVRQAYTHWGWVDKDAFVGDVARWLPPADLEAFDVISVMKMQSHQLYTSGLLTVFKNNDFSRTHWQLAGKQAIIDIVTKVRGEGALHGTFSPKLLPPASAHTAARGTTPVGASTVTYTHIESHSVNAQSPLHKQVRLSRAVWHGRRTCACADTWAIDETPSPAAVYMSCAVQPNNFMSDESITSNPILTSSNATVKFLMGGQAKLHAWEGREVLVRCATRDGVHVHDNTHCMPGLYVHLEQKAKFKRLCVHAPVVHPPPLWSRPYSHERDPWRWWLRAAACGVAARVAPSARSSLTRASSSSPLVRTLAFST